MVIKNKRHALTLVEMLAMLALMSIFAAMAFARLGPTLSRNFGAQADGRRLSLDLLQTQRRAISTGENHYLQFTPGGGPYTGYTIYRRTTSGNVAVESRQFSSGIAVTVSHAQAEFTFDGSALAAYTITLTASPHVWQVTVVPVTGTVRLVKI